MSSFENCQNSLAKTDLFCVGLFAGFAGLVMNVRDAEVYAAMPLSLRHKLSPPAAVAPGVDALQIGPCESMKKTSPQSDGQCTRMHVKACTDFELQHSRNTNNI